VRIRDVVTLAALAALACNKTATGPHAGISNSCSVALSGAITGTYDCQPATTSWSSTDDTGGFTFGVSASGSAPAIGLAIIWLGEPTDTVTYRSTDATAQADIFVTDGANRTWRATIGGGPPPAGSYVLNFTSVVNNGTTPGGKLYTTDGTITAVLPPVTGTGATDTLSLSVTF
jgi:hypothetical protein